MKRLKGIARIDCLLELSQQYFGTPKKDSIFYYADKAAEEAQKINYNHGLAVACLRKSGFAVCYQNDLLQAEKLAREAISWFSRTANKKEITLAYQILGRAQTDQSLYDEALTNLNLFLKWAQITSDSDWVGFNLETMTDIYRERGEYVKLLETQQKLIQMDRASGNNNYYSFHELWVLGLMYRLLEEYATALPFWRKLFVESLGDPISCWNQMEYAELLTQAGQADSALYYYNKFDSAGAAQKDLRFFLLSKGEYYLYLKQYSTALPYFRKALLLHQQLNDRRQTNRAFLDLAKTYDALHRNDSAIAYARQGLAMALQTKAKPLIRDGYKILSTVYDRLQQKDSAYFYYRNYITLKDAVMNDQTRGKMAAYDYEHRIENLANERQLQQQQIAQASLQKKLLLFGIAGLLLLGIIVLRNILLKRKNEINRRKLAESQLQLEKLEAERTKAELQQRATELEMQALRAQMNPHFIFNSLNSINRFILQNNRQEASEYLTKFSRLTRLILQNSQSALIPLESELEALRLYLELEALRFDHHFVYTIKVDDDLDVSALSVPPLTIQPFVENAIWHGLMHKEERGHLEIAVFEKEDQLCFQITDDGIGRKKAAEFKSKSAATHKAMGMRITTDRIAMLQQNSLQKPFFIIHDLVLPDGSPGGTEVWLRIPATL
ncbi:tetratricopeptide repeat-containing sensor histidine kinase [Flavisolibacter nicotianae]|uniref:tetratricopeptide repeat-containing sensor histidine kinase n=1 Tax=Flavisolibacter nicotianae TaxID=2364882 RepID=UPI0013C3FCCB|nr:histidine kinase [Flavisolibacter nicotianae]